MERRRFCCECGFVADEVGDEELVAAVERHIASVHPDLGGAPAREDVLAIAEELDYPLAEPGLGA